MEVLPSKILVIKLRSLGDTVLLTAALCELIRSLPQAEVHVLVPQSWAPLLENFPGVKKIWEWDKKKHKWQRICELMRLAFQFRKEKFDTVINFHASPSSALLSRATGAKTRSIHFHGHKDKNRYSTVSIPGKGILKPILERDADTLRALKIPHLKLSTELKTRVFLRDEEIRKLDLLLPWRNPRQALLVLSLGASRPTKHWSMEKFAQVARQWSHLEKGQALALAGPNEDHLIEEFRSFVKEEEWNKMIFANNTFSLRELASVLKAAHVLLTNDSGPKHLAIALGTPTVTLFGPEDPYEWHPYPQEKNPYFFIKDLHCRKSPSLGMPPWCGIPICIEENHQCMKKIDLDPVYKICKKLLYDFSSGATYDKR